MSGWAFLGDPALVRVLAGGLGITLLVAAGAIVGSSVIGALLALLRLSAWRIVRLPATVYVEIVRGLPSFLVIVYVFFAAGRLELGLSVAISVVLGLSLYGAALSAEIIRAGILSIERGQWRPRGRLACGPRNVLLTWSCRRRFVAWHRRSRASSSR